MAYIAQYSPRAGTAAEKLKDDVPKEEKKKREKALTEILKKTALEKNKKLINKTVETLVERIDKDYAFGKTRGFKNVKINIDTSLSFLRKQESRERSKELLLTGSRIPPIRRAGKSGMTGKDLIGKFVKVKITDVGSWNLEGKLTK